MAANKAVTNIAVLGGGAFGSAMAHISALKKTNNVKLYARDPKTVECINKFHINPKKLSQYQLDNSITATTDIQEALHDVDFILSCIPTQQTLPSIKQFKNYIPQDKPFVSCSKGMIKETEQFISQALHEQFGEDFPFYALSGPSFAEEIMKGYPTLLVLAGKEGENRDLVMNSLHHHQLRIYSQSDVIGVEIAGAMKNVISIGAGIIIGYGYGLNTVTGFVVKATHEMQLLAHVFGADPRTFFGLAGIGDLILTSFGSASRNRTFGERFGKGENLEQILEQSTGIVEGFYTLDAVKQYGEEHNIEMPIVNTIYDVVHGKITIPEASIALMGRKLSHEYKSMIEDYEVKHK